MARSLIVRAVPLCVAGVLLVSCMALPDGERAMFQDPALPGRGTLPLKAGLVTLRDARPAGERRTIAEIEDDFPGRITLELLLDLSEARLFSAIGQDTRGADVLLRGEIRSFVWEPRHNWVPYVPAFGIVAAFGLPVAYSTAQVELTIDVVNAKTDQPIGSYTKAATGKRSYWVYRFQDFAAGSDRELDSAFRRVTDELQKAILADREKIVAAVRP